MENNNITYFVFRKYTEDNTYYTLKDTDLNPIKETIKLSDDNVNNVEKTKFLKFNNNNNIESIKIINIFLSDKKYIKQSYNNDNITYIIYKDSKSLLTIRKLVKETNTLYIIEFENNNENLSDLFILLENNLENKDIRSIYQLFGIEKVFEQS